MKTISFLAKILMLFGFLAGPGGLFAQMEIARTERLSLEQGLHNQDVRDIISDSQGFLWLATGLHLERFDGFRFEQYKQNLHSRNIIQIEESAAKELYIRYNHLAFIDVLNTNQLECTQVFLDARNFLQGRVRAICLEKRGNLFVLTSVRNSLVISRLNSNLLFEKVCVLPLENYSDEHFKLIKTQGGSFWLISSKRGLFEFNTKGKILQYFDNKTFIPGHTGPAAILVLEPAVFQEDNAGRVWLSFKGIPGIWVYPKELHADIASNKYWPTEYFTHLWEDEHNNLLFALPTPGDRFTVSKLKGLRANGEVFDGSALLTVENKIQDIYSRDFEQQIFLGTYSGVYEIFLRNKNIRQYLNRNIKPGEFGAIVRSITSDRKGHIFFALEERAWYSIDTRSNRLDTIILTNNKGKPLPLISSGAALAYDPAGFLWGMSAIDPANKGFGLHRYNLADKTTRTYPLNGYLNTFYRQPNGLFYCIFRSESGGGYAGIFDPVSEKYTPYANADGTNPFIDGMPKCIIESRLYPGLFWVGTNDGLVAINWQKGISRLYGVSEINFALNFNWPDLLAIQEDETGTLWLGTSGGGLNILHFGKPNLETGFPDPRNLEIVDINQGLSNNLVSGVLPDGKGGCLCSTDLGLNYYNPNNQTVGNFFKQDGFTDNEFNRFSFFKDENDRFYFGTINGLNSFRLTDLMEQKPAGEIRFTKLTKYFAKSGRTEETVTGFEDLKELVIEPEVSYFQLDFVLTDYAQPDKNQFYAWLEGVENDWNHLGKTHTLRYNRLPAGNYTLHLRGSDAQGRLTEVPFSLKIRSEEFFYKTWWFLSFIGLIMVGAGWIFTQWRIRRVRAEEQRQAAMNARLVELETRALQAQMNPHFIFNCLNSIQSFIAEGDKENAMHYVTRFAQLTRAVLHFSGKITIGLDEEIEALSHYLELESLRSGQKIHYSMEVASDINTFDIELPPLLIQPFVENSFKHGKISDLAVGFQLDGQQLMVSIQDNGIGLQSKTNKSHQSKGVSLTRERLAFWNGRSDPADLRIEALEKGVLVTMHIKLK